MSHTVDHGLITRDVRCLRTLSIGIAGPALRDASHLGRVTPRVWTELVEDVGRVVASFVGLYKTTDPNPPKRILPACMGTIQATRFVLISGGSAFGDHTAVALVLRDPSLYLYLLLPCDFDMVMGEYDNRTVEGRRLNELHAKFSQRAGIDSLGMIKQALETGRAKIAPPDSHSTRGFARRNRLIALYSRQLIALAWPGEEYTNGTEQTVSVYRKKAKYRAETRVEIRTSFELTGESVAPVGVLV